METDNELEYNEKGDLIIASTKIGDITIPVTEELFDVIATFNTIREFKEFILL